MRKKSAHSLRQNNKGQFVVEAILLMVLSIGLLTMGLKLLRDNKAMANLISGPWQNAAGMIENGIWAPAKEAAAKHPNQRARSLSIDPKN